MYGLPTNVEFCSQCVMSNQKVTPSIVQKDERDSIKNTLYFENHLCEACRVHNKKDKMIDWDKRREELSRLCDKYRKSNGEYDCIVPGSGGKDSVYQSIILKEEFGMNPLTVTWAPHIYTEYGWRNFDRWIKKGGFDNFLFTPNGKKHALLTRLAYKNLLHPFQPFIFGQRNYVMHIAKQFGIKLIFFGENPAEYGGFKGEESDSKMSRMYYVDDNREAMKISGISLKELHSNYDISEEDLKFYLPLTSKKADESQLDPRWLGYFLKFHPQENYYFAQDHIGFEANDQRTEGTYSRYNSLDDRIDGFHYWTGYVKFGVGRTTHEASQEVRNGDLTREEAVGLVNRYDGEFPMRYAEDFAEYIGYSVDEIKQIADDFRPPHLWKKIDNEWELIHKIK
jgi:N-acetyl sugar amidotransferase